MKKIKTTSPLKYSLLDKRSSKLPQNTQGRVLYLLTLNLICSYRAWLAYTSLHKLAPIGWRESITLFCVAGEKVPIFLVLAHTYAISVFQYLSISSHRE